MFDLWIANSDAIELDIDFHAARDAAEVAEQRIARPQFDDLVAVSELARAAKAHGKS